MQKSQMVPYIRLMRLKKSTTGQESEYEQSRQHMWIRMNTVYEYVHGYTYVCAYIRSCYSCTHTYVHIRSMQICKYEYIRVYIHGHICTYTAYTYIARCMHNGTYVCTVWYIK